MGLYTLYGINGVGKDSVANEMKHDIPDLRVTSESRVLMHLLGIISEFDNDFPVTRDQYRQLEDTPQPVMRELEEFEYRPFVESRGRSSELTLIVSHLVFALFLDKKIEYLTDREVPTWFVDANTALVQLTAPPEVVLARRQADKRDRGAFEVADIVRHQSLCDEKWQAVMAQAGGTACHTVENTDLAVAVARVERIIHE